MRIGIDDFATARGPASSAPPPHAGDAHRALDAWQRRAWGLAIALAAEGHFEWGDLRQALLRENHGGERVADGHPWSQCRSWLNAFEGVVRRAGLVDLGALAELGRWVDRAVAHHAG